LLSRALSSGRSAAAVAAAAAVAVAVVLWQLGGAGRARGAAGAVVGGGGGGGGSRRLIASEYLQTATDDSLDILHSQVQPPKQAVNSKKVEWTQQKNSITPLLALVSSVPIVALLQVLLSLALEESDPQVPAV
jgi:hypothetical protein